MLTQRCYLPLIATFALVAPGVVLAQTSVKSTMAPVNKIAQTRSELIEAAEKYKATAEEVVRFQAQEIAEASKKLEQLRQLAADGLIARNELTAGEDVSPTRRKN